MQQKLKTSIENIQETFIIVMNSLFIIACLNDGTMAIENEKNSIEDRIMCIGTLQRPTEKKQICF